MQWIVSLFTTGGRINPIAIILLVASSIYMYTEVQSYFEKRELVRQSDVLQDACVEQVKVIQEARNEQKEAREVIDSGNFDNDFLKRLQDLD